MGNYNSILGQGNIVNSNGSVTGTGATGVDTNVVVGRNNYIMGNDNVVLGMNGSAKTKGDRNIAIGVSSGNQGTDSTFDTIAIGDFAKVNGNNSIAMGKSVAAGYNTDSVNSVSVALGYRVDTHNDGLAIGSGFSSSSVNYKLSAYNRSINLGYTNYESQTSSDRC